MAQICKTDLSVSVSDKTRDFRADCTACVALCCVAYAFDRSDEFGHDKPANHACHHLDKAHSCKIHGQLAAKGYKGCVLFDCKGAGQRVTRDVFGGGDWRQDPTLLAPMSAAFRTMRCIHEHLQLLEAAHTLPLDTDAETERQALIAMLEPELDWTPETLMAFDAQSVSEQVKQFLRTLAPRVVSS